MRLNVTRINQHHIGIYHCNAKNIVDLTKGSLMIDGKKTKVTLIFFLFI